MIIIQPAWQDENKGKKNEKLKITDFQLKTTSW